MNNQTLQPAPKPKRKKKGTKPISEIVEMFNTPIPTKELTEPVTISTPKKEPADNEDVITHYTHLPEWADPSSADYNPVRFLSEWSKRPEQFINPIAVEPTQPLNWFQKLLAMLGFGPDSVRIKIEKIKSDERIKLQQMQLQSKIKDNCKADYHECDDWKYEKNSYSVWTDYISKKHTPRSIY